MEPKYFKPYELVSKRMYNLLGSTVFQYFDDRILITLDTIRTFFGSPVTVNNWKWGGKYQYRGYREGAYRRGARYSMHRYWRAIDCKIKGVTATEARDVIMNHQKTFPYITRMEDNVSWLHFDNKNVNHHGILLFGK